MPSSTFAESTDGFAYECESKYDHLKDSFSEYFIIVMLYQGKIIDHIDGKHCIQYIYVN